MKERVMGLLQKGKWVDQWYETESNKGEFKRQESLFRNWISADGSAGPSGEACTAGRRQRRSQTVPTWTP